MLAHSQAGCRYSWHETCAHPYRCRIPKEESPLSPLIGNELGCRKRQTRRKAGTQSQGSLWDSLAAYTRIGCPALPKTAGQPFSLSLVMKQRPRVPSSSSTAHSVRPFRHPFDPVVRSAGQRLRAHRIELDLMPDAPLAQARTPASLARYLYLM